MCMIWSLYILEHFIEYQVIYFEAKEFVYWTVYFIKKKLEILIKGRVHLYSFSRISFPEIQPSSLTV